MKLEEFVWSKRLQTDARGSPLGPYLDGFIAWAEDQAFSPVTVRHMALGAVRFARFLVGKGVTDARCLTQGHVDEFISGLPRYCQGRYIRPAPNIAGAARKMLLYLRGLGVSPSSAPQPPVFAPLLDEWLTFLRKHRGLSDGTLGGYRYHVGHFLQELGPVATHARLQSLDPTRIRNYIASLPVEWSRCFRKKRLSAIRIFLRFAHDYGYLPRDLTPAVGRVPFFRDERLPQGPAWKDVLKLPGAVDRSTLVGRRDFTILHFLIAYGIRAGQLCRLTLDDIDWRRSRIRFAPAKQGRQIDVPLFDEVGNALLDYLRVRPHAPSRVVFLTVRAPYRPLRPDGAAGVVRRAFDRAAVQCSFRTPYAIRHAWATRMLAEGRPLKTIADLMGHRSIESTLIYAKVDQARLRIVAHPWPVPMAEVRS